MSALPQSSSRPACVDHDLALFFPNKDDGRQYNEARKVCAGCGVREKCLADAMHAERAGERHGLFGGLTPRERTRLHRTGKMPEPPASRLAILVSVRGGVHTPRQNERDGLT